MKYVFFIFSLMPQHLWSQYLFDFEIDTAGNRGVCVSNRVEQVPAGHWGCLETGAISGAYSLHHSYDNSVSGCDYFIITLDPIKANDSLIFSFRLRHGYPPSAANNWQLAFLADFSDGQITSGLIVGVNYRGSDDLVKLWECLDGESREICETTLNYQDQIGMETAPEFKLVWTGEGIMMIYFSRDPINVDPEQIGSCQLDSLPMGRKLVVRYEYSSSQDRKLWIDDILLEGHFTRDTIAPFATGVSVLDGKHLEVSFSEQIVFPEVHSFQLIGPTGLSEYPDSLYSIPHGVVLMFRGIIANREEHQLRICGICDLDSNCLSDTLIICLRNDAEWGDVVFNELMVDPIPVVLLPEEEYLEIYNRSIYQVDLTDWRIEVNSRSHVISGLLGPGAYGLITGISLQNEGATLALYSDQGTLIHAAQYNIPWNGPDWKKEGGWSLESPDPGQVCNISNLWEFSSNPGGGTPGKINSKDADLEDLEPPLFLYPGVGEMPGLICIHFSEPVGFSPQDFKDFKFQPGDVNADSVVLGNPIADQLNVWFPDKIQEYSEYKVHLPALADCTGNLSGNIEFPMGRVSKVHFGSILINEIMYNPEEGAPEYIELYVPGDDYYDLRDLSLDMGFGGTLPDSPIALSDLSRIISPGEYLVVTKNVYHLMEFYHLELSGRWIGVKEMGGMNNSGGEVYLTDRAGSVVDVAFFGNQMHMELMDVTKGISLERLSIERSGTVADNWHSAASIEGYSTPGRVNSQSIKESGFTGLFSLEPKVFSPDNDGFQDLLQISIAPGTQGWVIGMWITDLMGRNVRSLANNHLSGPSVIYSWNGLREDGQMAEEGIYVIHVRGYHPDTGESWIKKEAFGLIYP